MTKSNSKLNAVATSPVLKASFWEQIGKKLAASLSKKYRFTLAKAATTATTITFEDWSERFSGQDLHISLFRAEGIRSPVFFVMNAASSAAVCNVLLGGTIADLSSAGRRTANHAPISRQLELRFVQVFAAQIEYELVKFGCGGLRYCSSESDLGLYNQIPLDIKCLSVDFSFSTDTGDIAISLLFPVEAASRLRLVKSAAELAESGITLLSYKHLQDIEVEVSVTLGQLQMTLKELVQLVPGELLSLEKNGEQLPRLKVEGKMYRSGRVELDDHEQWMFVVES